MPVVEPIIREMLGQSAASYAPEKIFSLGKFVINDHRTSLLPERAETLIMSAARFKMQLSSKFLSIALKTIWIQSSNLTMSWLAILKIFVEI